MFDFSVKAEAQRPACCRRASTAVAIVLALISLSTARMAVAADGTDKPSDWPLYHGNSKSWRYSELDQINKSNVKRLKVAWIHQPGDITGGLQATPSRSEDRQGTLGYSTPRHKKEEGRQHRGQALHDARRHRRHEEDVSCTSNGFWFKEFATRGTYI